MKYSYLILSLILSFNIFPAEQKSKNPVACSSNESGAEIDDIGLDFELELDTNTQTSKKTSNKQKDIPGKIQQILDEIKEHPEIGHSDGFKGANNLVFAIQHCDNEEIARCIMLAYNRHRLFNVNSPNKLNDDLLPLQAAFELLYDKDSSTKIKKKINFRINYPIVKLLLACNADPRKKGFMGFNTFEFILYKIKTSKQFQKDYPDRASDLAIEIELYEKALEFLNKYDRD